jgi:hypothetical protein
MASLTVVVGICSASAAGATRCSGVEVVVALAT